MYSIHWRDIKKTIYCIKGWSIHYRSHSESIFLPRKDFFMKWMNKRRKYDNHGVVQQTHDCTMFCCKKTVFSWFPKYARNFNSRQKNILRASCTHACIFYASKAHTAYIHNDPNMDAYTKHTCMYMLEYVWYILLLAY